MICAIKDLAIEKGRTPTSKEFYREVAKSESATKKYFDTYTVLVLAAELEPNQDRKITNKIFEKDIERHLDQYHSQPQEPLILEPYPDAAIISDIHWPFVNRKVETRFIEYVGDVKPMWVILNGDAWDMYSHAKFPRSHNQFTPREEMALARKMNEDFWAAIKRGSPKSKCQQMLGNHDVRPMKRIMEVYPEAEDWIAEKLKAMFTFDGVTTMYDAREELFLNKSTIVFHGYRSKLGEHRDYTLLSTFNGHTHRGGVVYRKVRQVVLFECNSGLAGDPLAKGLTYTPQKIVDWTPGFSACDKLGPRFIPVD